MFQKLRAWIKRVWASQVVDDDPDPVASESPSRSERWNDEGTEFVLKLGDGNYYAGAGARPGQVVRTSNIDQATHYPNRWAALHAAGQGIEFDRASIVPYMPRRRRA